MADDKDVDTYASAPTAQANPATAETQQPDQADDSPLDLAAPGYQLGALLGRGGMGEVIAAFALVLARDRRTAQMRLTMQAWHLGQLLPETPQVVAAPHTTRL